MTVTLRPFEPVHLMGFHPQLRQVHDYEHAIETRSVQFRQAWTAFAGGRAVCVAGMAPIWAGRAIAWALLSRHAGPHMRALTRAAIKLFQASEHQRIELCVDVDWLEAQRWARLLGFQLETPRPMRACLPNGADALLFARLRQTQARIAPVIFVERCVAALH